MMQNYENIYSWENIQEVRKMSKFNYDILKEAKGMSMEVFEFDSKEEADEFLKTYLKEHKNVIDIKKKYLISIFKEDKSE